MIFSGGRYDGLVKRFTGQKVPATGAALGLDRFLEAMRCLQRLKTAKATAQVLVTTMDKSLTSEYQKITFELRQAGIASEMFLGKRGGLTKQLKYADYWDIPLAIIVGGDEMAKQEVTIKDLRQGRELDSSDKDREQWLKTSREVQMQVPRSDMISSVCKLLQ